MSEREEKFDLQEALKLADALKAVEACRSVLALDALKGVIDRRMAELERAGRLIEQNTEKTEQKAPILGQTPQKMGQIPQKTGQKIRGPPPIYDRSQVLCDYGTNKIFKPVLEDILRDTKDLFTQTDIAGIITKHYGDTLKRHISDSSADAYAFNYVKYMLSERLIKKSGETLGKGAGRHYIQYKKINSLEQREKDLGIINGTKTRDRTVDMIKERQDFENEVCGGTKDL